MIINATFWVAISFVIFLGLLIYFKIPRKIITSLNDSILNIKTQIDDAESLKEEAKNILSENEKRLSNSKKEMKNMLSKANEQAQKNMLKANDEFHKQMENRKKNAEEKIKQIKDQALKDIKNASVKISIDAAERILKNSLDKSKLDKLYLSSIEETKLALKKKSS